MERRRRSGGEEEQLSALTHEDFDVRGWINSCLNEREGGDETVEAYLQRWLLRLQQESESLHKRVGEQMSQVLGALPRAFREVDRIGRDAESLESEIENLLEQLRALQDGGHGEDGSTVSAITTLEHLHVIKTNLNQTLDVVEQSASWDRLVREVEGFFSARDLVSVAGKLGNLRSSVDLLKGMPGHEDRKELLLRMEQRLETLIGPGLRDAIKKCLEVFEKDQIDDAENELQGFVGIFEKLERLEHLYKDFAQGLARPLMQEWVNVQEGVNLDFSDWLPRYHEILLSNLRTEKNRCDRIFGAEKSCHVLHSVVIEVLESLNVQFTELLDQQDETSRITVFHKTLDFADEIIELLYSKDQESLQKEDMFLATVAVPFVSYVENFEKEENASLSFSFETKAGKVSATSITTLLNDPQVVKLVEEESIIHWRELTLSTKTRDLLECCEIFWTDFSSKCAQLIKQMTAGSGDDFEDPTDAFWEERISKALQNMQAGLTFAKNLEKFLAGPFLSGIKQGLRPKINGSAARTRLKALWLTPENETLEKAIIENDTLPENVLARIGDKTKRLIDAAQQVAFENMLAPIQFELAEVSTKRLWGIEDDEDKIAFERNNGEGETVSEFGTPLRYMQRVVHHLSNLVQHLEPFAEFDAGESSLPQIEHLGNRARAMLEEILDLQQGERLSFMKNFMESNKSEEDLDLFTRNWLNAVAFGASDLFLLQILQIPRLGALASSQLLIDLKQLLYLLDRIAAPEDPILEECRVVLEGISKDPDAIPKDSKIARVWVHTPH